MPDSGSESGRLDALLEQWQEAMEQGRAATAVELCSDCPELVPELAQRIDWLQKMHRLTHSLQRDTDANADLETGDGRSPAAASLAPVPATLAGQRDAGSSSRGWPTIAGYEIEAFLGEGGMGAVYRARELRLGRQVALKVIRNGVVSAEQRARFEIEAQAVAKMQHPNIVQVFAFGEWPAADGCTLPYLALEYMEGGNLESYVGDRPLPAFDAARLVKTLALAIEHAHRKGIVHRDLKPANILLSVGHEPLARADRVLDARSPLDGIVPKVSDFGLAKRLDGGMGKTLTGTVVGTAAYMAPEQAEGLPTGPPADIYALGAILYRLLSGRAPFHAASLFQLLKQVCQEPPSRLRELVPDVPLGLEQICLRCLAKKPADRYPDAVSLAAALDDFISGTAPTKTISVAPKRHRRRWVIAGTAAVVLFAVLVAGWLLNRPGGDATSIPVSSPPVATLRMPPISVDYLRLSDDKKRADPPQRMGEEVSGAHFDDAVVLSIQLDMPVYCYVLGFAADGSEQLLWPSNDEGVAAPDVAPTPIAALPRLPLGGNQFRLDEEPAGGLQVYVVCASRQPLPAYSAWCLDQRKPITWTRQPNFAGVWRADEKAASIIVKKRDQERSVRPEVGTPPLARLCQELKSGGVEAVEAIAFSVAPRE